MKTYSRRKKARRRKCRHCHELFTPDPRNLRHQQHCSDIRCRQASKKAAQHRWLSSSKGEGYFEGPENAARVRLWREDHPGYSKRSRTKRSCALQDVSSSQVIEKKEDTRSLNHAPLQDLSSLQPALLIGLIASLTGSTLQDDIAETARRLVVSGRDILGFCAQTNP